MKVRNGFVSNSSSSSFILFGVKIDVKPNEELCRKYFIKENIENYIKENNSTKKDNTCTNCNIIHKTDIKFCGNCGSELKIIETLEDVDWDDMWYMLAYEEEAFKISDIEMISDDGPTYFGKTLAYDSDYLDNGEYSISELTELSEKFKEYFDDECKLYYGTVAS